jgi:hypothetical protein
LGGNVVNSAREGREQNSGRAEELQLHLSGENERSLTKVSMNSVLDASRQKTNQLQLTHLMRNIDIGMFLKTSVQVSELR